MRMVTGTGQISYGTTPFPPAAVVATGTPAAAVPSSTQPPNQQTYQYFDQQQQQQLQVFWANQMQEIEQTSDFKNHCLPLARIKRIMKADEDVRMISAEAPVLFAKACELFILELTLWLGSTLKRMKGGPYKRKILQPPFQGPTFSISWN